MRAKRAILCDRKERGHFARHAQVLRLGEKKKRLAQDDSCLVMGISRHRRRKNFPIDDAMVGGEDGAGVALVRRGVAYGSRES